MVGTSQLIEKVPATTEWTWVVFISCIMVFITTPIFLYIMICVAKKHQNASKWILYSTFGYIICLLFYSITQFIIFNPSRWNIQPSQKICTFIKRPEIVFIALARFCFYQFCLLRINIVFDKLPKVKLPKYQFILMQILIFGYLIYHAIIFNILTTMSPHPVFGFCFATQDNSDVHVGIFILWDALIVFILICMFAVKLIRASASDDISLHRFTIKTSILGILSTFSSLMVTVLFFCGRMNRFVFVTDGFVNSICIVLSFKMSYVVIPNFKWCCNEQKLSTQKDDASRTQTYNVVHSTVELETVSNPIQDANALV